MLWRDSNKTQLFAFVLLIAFFALTVIPPRIFFTFVILHRFYKGKLRANRIRRNNRANALLTLNAIFNLPELRNLFLKAEDSTPWKAAIYNSPALQKKVAEGLRVRLSLDIDEKTIFLKCKSPLELLNLVASCEAKLVIAPGAKDVKKKVKGKKSVLKGFLLNIPSEYYCFQYPVPTGIKRRPSL